MNPVYITFGLYLVVVLGLGFAAYFATRNFDDYILGGRSLGSFITAMSAGASDMSGWLLMGLPGAVFVSGLSEAWIAIGLTLGAYINWLLVAGRLRVHTEVNANALTLPEYFYHRFGGDNRLLKIISAKIILIFFTIYCASGIVAGARLFESLFDISYGSALWLGAFATIAYTFVGGFLAVSWTDTLQATLMFFALLLVPVMIYLNLGGMAEIQAAIDTAAVANNKNYGSLLYGTTVVGVISSMAWGLGYFGQPHILARFMAADTVKSLVNARRIGMMWMVVCLLSAVLIGYFGIAYFNVHPNQVAILGGNSEQIFIGLTRLLFNPWIVGVVLSALLAAVMSTLSCQLLVCASAITEDFYKGFIRPHALQKELVWIGRAMVLAVALVAIWLAQNPDSRVLGLVAYAWAGFGAAFGPVVLFSLFWQRMSGAGALAGMVVGALTVVLWKRTGSALYEIVPGFVLASVAIYVVSMLKPVPPTVAQRFDEGKRLYQLAD